MQADIEALEGNKKSEAILAEWANDLPGFILETGYFKTKDEHNQDKSEPIPNKDYLRTYLQELQDEQFVVVTKSRQVMVTWATLAYLLGCALTRRNQLIICQSKRLEDALSLVQRLYHLHDNLPGWIRKARPRKVAPLAQLSKLEIPCQESMIWAVPQGPDIVRSNTVSIYFSDETDFQPDATASIRAAMPSIVGGGQAILVSTPVLGGLTQKLIKGTW